MSNKNKVGRVYIPASGVATNKNKHNEGSPLIRLTGDEFATTAESALYNLNDINSDNSGGVLTNNGTVTFAHDSDLGETVGTYNGSSQYLSRATEAQFEVGTGSFTASIQFKCTSLASGDTIFNYGDLAASEQNWYIGFSGTAIRCACDDGTNQALVLDSLSDVYLDNKWHTATMMLDTSLSTDTLFLWVDGKLIGSASQALVTLNNVGEKLYIGSTNAGGATDYFNGQLANFHLIKSADYNAVQVLNQGIRESVYNGATYTLDVATTHRLNNRFFDASGTQDGYYTTIIDVEEGLYEIITHSDTRGNGAISSIQIDGAEVMQVDHYNASSPPNAVNNQTDIPLSAGRHILKILNNTKNGSSGGYHAVWNWIDFIKRNGHEEGGATEFLLLGDEINQRDSGFNFGYSANTSTFYNNLAGHQLGGDADDLDYVEGEIFIKGGLYRIDFVYGQFTTCGKADLDFGNVEVLDQYATNGTTTYNVVKTVNVKLNQGKNNIRLAVNGTSGTDYQILFSAIRGIRIGN